MRLIFMGTPDFAVPSLRILLDHGYDVVAVITAPDKPGGRQGVLQSAVKQFSVARGLRVLQPEKLRNPEFLAELQALRADLQVVVAFRMLPEVVWNMPPHGTLNLHGSLLPKYRGAAPINWAIIRGEEETGVTTFLLRHEIDTGDVLLQTTLPIGPDDTAGDLHDRMMQVGAELVLATVRQIESGQVTPIPQSSLIAVSNAPKLFTESCQIDFGQSAHAVHNFVRGLSPYPGAWTILDEKIIKVLKTSRLDFKKKTNHPVGTFLSDGKTYLQIVVDDGVLGVEEVQMEGKRRMSVGDFLNGYKRAWDL
jgi:methionyl-tRNA formyltransferase